jgi:hypothetical protein
LFFKTEELFALVSSVLLVFLCSLMVLNINQKTSALILYVSLVTVYATFLLKVKECSSTMFWMIATIGILYRLLPCLTVSTTFSNDIIQYGYLGDKILNGQIPYKDFSAPYPPLSIYITVPFLMAGDLRLMKLFFVICDLVIIFLIYNTLKSQRLPLGRVRLISLILLLFPASLLEYSVSGHNDSFTLLLSLISIILLDNRPATSSTFLSLSICSKIFPVVAIPFILKHFLSENRKAVSRFLLMLVPVLGLISLPFIVLSSNAYFDMLLGVTRFSIPYGFFQTLLFKLLDSPSQLITVLIISFSISTVIFLTIFAFSYLQAWPFMKSLSIAFAFLPFLLPQFQPWYLLWALPFVILYFSKNWKLTEMYMLLLLFMHTLCYLISL